MSIQPKSRTSKDRFATWSDRSRHIMPWGSSTCSKAPKWLPEEPEAIQRGEGCRVWDIKGREFIDFRNALGPITLGYSYPEVNEAIRRQLNDGVLYGHPHPLECEVAEMFCGMVPCAEQARFLKTGGEAVAACIRLARHHTGREHVIQVGYNGWLNSLSQGAPVLPGQHADVQAPPGVPPGLAALHHNCAWADPDAVEYTLRALNGQVAAIVIASAYESIDHAPPYYERLRELADAHGTLLIFDEIVTGFRVARGGVQERFGVTPDLAVFAKGVANGMPLSVYTGRRQVMCGLEQVVVSSTYGGEALSLAAAAATMKVYRDQDVIGHLHRQGRRLRNGINTILDRLSLPMILDGYDPCPCWTLRDGVDPAMLPLWRERITRACYRQGLSVYNICYLNFSHSDTDIDEALQRFDAALTEVAKEPTEPMATGTKGRE